jgi:diacylglycerol kinase family enzyme
MLFIIHIGRGTDFCRTLEIYSFKRRLRDCIDIIADGYTIASDIGLVKCLDNNTNEECEKYFLNESSFGATGDVVEGVNVSSGKVNSSLVYTYHAAKAAFCYERVPIKHRRDDEEWKSSNIFIGGIANGKWFGNGINFCPIASITDENLNLILVENIGFLKVLKLMSLARTGKHLNTPGVNLIEKSKTYHVISEGCRPVLIECDGELVGKLPGTWTCIPNAIKLVVPKNFKPL